MIAWPKNIPVSGWWGTVDHKSHTIIWSNIFIKASLAHVSLLVGPGRFLENLENTF